MQPACRQTSARYVKRTHLTATFQTILMRTRRGSRPNVAALQMLFTQNNATSSVPAHFQ